MVVLKKALLVGCLSFVNLPVIASELIKKQDDTNTKPLGAWMMKRCEAGCRCKRDDIRNAQGEYISASKVTTEDITARIAQAKVDLDKLEKEIKEFDEVQE